MSIRNKLAVAALSLSVAGSAFIVQWEGGFQQKAYLDAVGVPTICAGSTSKVFLPSTATLKECEERLVEDSTFAGSSIKKHVKVKLTQEQYDALVSFVFNVGGTNFRRSALLRKLNTDDCVGAGLEFNRWVYAKGKRLRGLERRRAAESAMFMKGCV